MSAEVTLDYEALRHGVGAVVLGRDVISVEGPDALEYLQGQCSQDLAALAVGSSADALVLTPQGKLDALIRVTRTRDDRFLVDVDDGYGPAVVTRLTRFKLRVKVDITPLDWTAVALRGPEARSVVDAGADAQGSTGVADGAPPPIAFEWNGVVGVDLLGPGVAVPAGVRRCGAEAWQSVRVEAGIPVMGAELDERTIAAEADLLERCVSFTKGCYTGQELVARLDARGNKVARRLRGVVMDALPDGAPHPGPGAEVTSGAKSVGRLTSVAWSPSLGTTVALAYIHRDVEPPSPVEVATADAQDGAGAGGATVGATVRVLPLLL
ncbi:MAG TPA: glycine cleavage T C-terminal barrel domain-containing protein [Acidimicrobiales bacterium]|nr:glycine cleavage T C-terminal barrel domain-containing protein [Acidimicrobiales bacterium]